MIPPRLGVVLADADGNTLAPRGRHIRWFVPGRLGPPDGGFDILHLPADAWRRQITQLARRIPGAGTAPNGPVGQPLSEPAGDGGDHTFSPDPLVDVRFRPSTELRAETSHLVLDKAGAGENLLLRFSEPILWLRLKFRSVGGRGEVQYFHRSALLTTSPLETVVDQEMAGITDVLVPLGFDRLTEIWAVTESAVRGLKIGTGIDLLATVPTPQSGQEAMKLLAANLAPTITNRMLTATTENDIVDRYPKAEVHRLVGHLRSTVGRPDRTVASPAGPGAGERDVGVLSMLAAAALDPNVARLLGWSHVDTRPQAGLLVVRAKYPISPAVGYAFTHQAAPPPTLAEQATATQAPGIRFDREQPIGRVEIGWSRRPGGLADQARPVLVDVRRRGRGGDVDLTERRPRTVAPGDPSTYLDEAVPTGEEYRYRLVPIDIFGRLGQPVETNPVKVRNLAAPLPPRRVKLVVEQNGHPWLDPAERTEPEILRGRVAATAEWGEAQRAASPTARTLTWYWHEGVGTPDRSPPGWTAIGTVPLPEPTEAKVELSTDTSAATVRLLVAAVERLEV